MSKERPEQDITRESIVPAKAELTNLAERGAAEYLAGGFADKETYNELVRAVARSSDAESDLTHAQAELVRAQAWKLREETREHELQNNRSALDADGGVIIKNLIRGVGVVGTVGTIGLAIWDGIRYAVLGATIGNPPWWLVVMPVFWAAAAYPNLVSLFAGRQSGSRKK